MPVKSWKLICVCLILGGLFSFRYIKKTPGSSLGKSVVNFSIKSTKDYIFNLSDSGCKGYIVIFTCNHCPFAKLYSARLNTLNAKYKQLGVPLIAINSMDTALYDDETFSSMQQKAESEHFSFPYLQDSKQTVGKLFGAEHTPQAYILWRVNNTWIIKYSGAIDDNGQHPELANSFIEKALDELLQNKPVTNPETESFGCRIYYRK